MAQITEKQWREAETGFGETQAARMLRLESDEAHRPAGDALSLSKLISMAKSGQNPAALFASFEGPMPLGAIRLYRALLAKASLGASKHARAASTEGQMERELGPYHMELVMEEDAAFMMIDVNDNPAPHFCVLLHDDGRHQSFDLDEPVDGAIQFGVSINNPQYDALIDLLQDPVTSIYLQ